MGCHDEANTPRNVPLSDDGARHLSILQEKFLFVGVQPLFNRQTPLLLPRLASPFPPLWIGPQQQQTDELPTTTATNTITETSPQPRLQTQLPRPPTAMDRLDTYRTPTARVLLDTIDGLATITADATLLQF